MRQGINLQSRLHGLDKQLAHALEQHSQLARLVDALQHALDLIALELGPAVLDVVVAPAHDELKPSLALPTLLIDVRVDELEPVFLASALDAQAQVRHPEIQLGHVEARLRLELRCVRALRCHARVDLALRRRDLRLECIPCRRLLIALRRQGRDGGLHLARLGRLLGYCLLVRVGLELQDLNVLFLHALVLCEKKLRQSSSHDTDVEKEEERRK